MGFIKKIEIENFYSIKDRIALDFLSSDYMVKNHSERTIEFEGINYSTLNVIYGANASGKSSILRALVIVAQIITNSSDEKLPNSFKNKFFDKRRKSRICIEFVIDNSTYIYEIILNSNSEYLNDSIHNEVLYAIALNKKMILIDRQKSQVNNVEDNIRIPILEKINDKKSLIYEFMKFDSNFEKIFGFFRHIKHTTNIQNAYITNTLPSFKMIESSLEIFKKESNSLEMFLIKFLNNIGIDITEFIPNYKVENGKEVLRGFLIKHRVSKTSNIELILESDGTMNLIQVLVSIYFAKIGKSILIIDELDSMLHPMLVPLINKLLIDNSIQVIYTTHNIYNMKYLYHDEITLIEKDERHKTIVKQLKNMKDIKFDDNILDLYEEGYFGGIPDIKALDTTIL
ncbi:AAA family ATPase [Aliarcobacter cryaerophilus]|uniref:AAA family ATPase n=1 Tax=Aliarcobacter cryaerophilus TaxID=28198 RepID=UPI003BB1A4FC